MDNADLYFSFFFLGSPLKIRKSQWFEFLKELKTSSTLHIWHTYGFGRYVPEGLTGGKPSGGQGEPEHLQGQFHMWLVFCI